MIAKLSIKISSFFIKNSIIKEEEKDTYIYCLEILLSTILNFLCLIVISVVTGTVPETMAFVIGFVPMRRIAGGYHAKNHFRCLIVLLVIYTTFLITIFNFDKSLFGVATIFLTTISIFLIFAFAPVDDQNKRFSVEERSRLKLRSRILIAIYTILLFVMYLLSIDNKWSFYITYGILSSAISVLCGFLKNKIISFKGEKYHE